MESLIIAEVFGAINRQGENMFHDICKHGCLSLLLRAGWWLDQTTEFLLQEYDYDGNQCIHIVASRHRQQNAIRLLEILVELGADLNARDRTSGATALHIAVCYKDYELTTWLCQQPTVDLEARNYGELTAYQMAYKRYDNEMMDIFLKYDADCDQPYSSSSDSDSES